MSNTLSKREKTGSEASSHDFTVVDEPSVSLQVVDAVSAVSGRPPAHVSGEDPIDSLDPLYDAIDPDALNAMCRQSRGDESGTATLVEFSYCGYDVTIETADRTTITVSE